MVGTVFRAVTNMSRKNNKIRVSFILNAFIGVNVTNVEVHNDVISFDAMLSGDRLASKDVPVIDIYATGDSGHVGLPKALYVGPRGGISVL